MTNCIWKFTPQHRNHTDYVLTFELESEQEVSKYLRGLKRNKAIGVDIPPGYLKDVAYVIAKPLTHIINLSLNTGLIPSDFKQARIQPLFKSGAKIMLTTIDR